MELYSSLSCCYCHSIRFVLAEKELSISVHQVDPDDPPDDLSTLNPYRSVPTLVDRDLVLYDYRVIMEYLDERFPHPPLLPPDPINRARMRMALNRIDTEWYRFIPPLEKQSGNAGKQARKLLTEGLVASIVVFEANPFFLSTDFSLLDCVLGPLLWRLPSYDITLPPSAKAVQIYAKRLFDRPGFQASLSTIEKEMRS